MVDFPRRLRNRPCTIPTTLVCARIVHRNGSVDRSDTLQIAMCSSIWVECYVLSILQRQAVVPFDVLFWPQCRSIVQKFKHENGWQAGGQNNLVATMRTTNQSTCSSQNNLVATLRTTHQPTCNLLCLVSEFFQKRYSGTMPKKIYPAFRNPAVAQVYGVFSTTSGLNTNPSVTYWYTFLVYFSCSYKDLRSIIDRLSQNRRGVSFR